MRTDYQILKTKLDDAFRATDKFIEDYATRMEFPISFLETLVAALEKTDDPLVRKANVETLEHTLSQMNTILRDLMESLNVCQQNSNVTNFQKSDANIPLATASMKTYRSKDEFSEPQLDVKKFYVHTQGCALTQLEIMATFIEETPGLLVELDNALLERMASKASKLVHRLKLSVAVFCTDSLYAELLQYETAIIRVESHEFLAGGRSLIMKIGKLVQELRVHIVGSRRKQLPKD